MKTCNMSDEDKKQEEKWRAEDDLRVLKQAAEITSDPKRLKAVQTLAKQESKQLEKLSDGDYLKKIGLK